MLCLAVVFILCHTDLGICWLDMQLIHLKIRYECSLIYRKVMAFALQCDQCTVTLQQKLNCWVNIDLF